MHWIRLARLLPTLVLALACRAGGEIATVPEWTLSAEPTLVIGEDGTTAGEFERVSTALALPGDEVAVVDAGASEIRVFSGSGAYLRTLGRRGEGPGEFNGISWVQLAGDTLIAYSIPQRRLTLLGLNGALLATILPQAEGASGFAFPRGRSPSGEWVVAVMVAAAASAAQGGGMPSGLVRDSLALGLLPATGSGPVGFFARLPSQPILGVPEANVGMLAPLFGMPQVVIAEGRMAVLDPNAGTLAWYSPTGEPQSAVPLGVARRPFASGWLDSARGASLDGITDQRRRLMIDAAMRSEAAPAEFPVFRSVLADDADQLWLEEWQLEAPSTARYLVVAADGSLRARVSMPGGFTPTAIGPDWVLGVHRDADGLNRVMRHGLRR